VVSIGPFSSHSHKNTYFNTSCCCSETKYRDEKEFSSHGGHVTCGWRNHLLCIASNKSEGEVHQLFWRIFLYLAFASFMFRSRCLQQSCQTLARSSVVYIYLPVKKTCVDIKVYSSAFRWGRFYTYTEERTPTPRCQICICLSFSRELCSTLSEQLSVPCYSKFLAARVSTGRFRTSFGNPFAECSLYTECLCKLSTLPIYSGSTR
jgi:hypothetical protein